MRLFSYIVARDFGFAPNPFYGVCTLATCKRKIRAAAQVDDWIVGTGAAGYGYAGRLVFAMQVGEVVDFDTYWADARFARKKPDLNGSLQVMYGDNIYHREAGRWCQADSHHSLEGGRINQENLADDTGVNRVLIATKFVYWGGSAPVIPNEFRRFGVGEEDLCHTTQGHQIVGEGLAAAFLAWLENQGDWGRQGEPYQFRDHERRLL